MSSTLSPTSTRRAGPIVRPRRHHGFTLVEVLTVLAVLAILLAIALPRIDFGQFQVDTGGRLVRMTLQAAQRLAVTRQYDVIVSFDVADGRIRMVEDNNNNGAVDPGEHVTWYQLDDSVHFAPPPAPLNGGTGGNAVVGSNLVTIDGMPSVIFRRDGAASTNLTLYVVSKGALPNDYRAIDMQQSTGRTAWYRYLNGLWQQASL